VYYADIVFQQLGPYVKHWLTFSDPMAICQLGYGIGIYAPGVEKGAMGHYRCVRVQIQGFGLWFQGCRVYMVDVTASGPCMKHWVTFVGSARCTWLNQCWALQVC
jgi:beta-glucosidase/6-phospho-beta-glucosidase/beta-galactosidase